MRRRRGDAPPSLAGRILDLLERPGEAGAARGDLDEEYARHVLPKRGRPAARRWYWGQALRSVPVLLVHRFRPPGRGPNGWFRRRGADLRYALRALARRPGTTVAAAATFALALGANTAVFSVVWGVLLRPLPYADASRLVRIHPDEPFYTQLSGAQRFAEHASVFDAIAPWGPTLFTFTGDGVAEEVRGGLVAWDHFEMLGVRPVLGRTFRREDAEAWPYESIILSHQLWVRRFGADPGVVSRRVEVGGRMRTVVGVMGAEHVPIAPDWEAWAPLPSDATLVAGMGIAMNARLNPGVTLDEATIDARRAFAESWAVDGYTATPEELAPLHVVPLRDFLLGDASRPLQVLMVTVLGLLLLACANVANLLLAQGEGRAAELGVRLSLGATPGRVSVQLLLETAVTAALGCVAGFLLASFAVTWVASRLPAAMPRTGDLGVGGAAYAFAVLAALAAVFLSGSLPVLRVSSRGLRDAVTRGGGSRAGGTGRLAPLLVGLEVAMAVILVVGAGLLLRSLGALTSVDPGFDPRGVVAMRVSPPAGHFAGDDAIIAFYDRVRAEVSSLSGVTAVGAVMFLPMTSGGAWDRYRPDAAPLGDEPEVPSTSFRIVTPGYLEAMDIALLRGRVLTAEDHADAPRVAVINGTAARALFPGEDPVGRRLYEGVDGPGFVTVVGIVADVRQTNLREPSFPELYLPLAQSPFRRMYVVARATGDPVRTLEGMRARLLALDGDLVLSGAGTLEDVVDASLAQARLLAQFLTVFGLVALALGAVGVYGVTAHSVSRTKREIGIRLALGADGRSVASRVLRRGMIPVGFGVGVGIGLAVLLSRLLTSLLFGVGALDPLTFLAVPALLSAVALAVIAVPAARAGRLDPVRMLREE